MLYKNWQDQMLNKINNQLNNIEFFNMPFTYEKLYTIQKFFINFDNNQITLHPPYFEYYGKFYERELFDNRLMYGFINYKNEGIVTYFGENFFKNTSKIDINNIEKIKLYCTHFIPITKFHEINEDIIPGPLKNERMLNGSINNIYKMEVYV